MADADQARQAMPHRVGIIGMVLFLAALTMLFAAAVLGYVVIRLTNTQAPELGSLSMPTGLWVSSLLIVASSIALEMACGYIRRERQKAFRRALLAAGLLALAFISVQTPSMALLLSTHQQLRAQGMPIYGLVFLIILLHALHVVGGLIPLATTTVRAYRHRYDHEHWQPVRLTAAYWHFLGVVWVVTFAVFLTLG